MARIKIDYGIDLGTTNSAIARMENGEASIKQTKQGADTLPSCVFFSKNKKGEVVIKTGIMAKSSLESDVSISLKKKEYDREPHGYLEFKREMGNQKKYSNPNMDRSFYTPEDLSAEILKSLKQIINDEKVNSVVITVPAKFNISQKEATSRAAKLAGFEHCELLQEPIAAAMAYGVTSDEKNGYWLVFDFGGGTFDTALLKVEDGIPQIIDTEGDNYLGGKNLDSKVINDILIPHLRQEYELDSILDDESGLKCLREGLKSVAEKIRIELSFAQSVDFSTYDSDDDFGCDDNDNEIDVEITLTQDELKYAIESDYQRAVDICKTLLERNNLSNENLNKLILVGGPTYSPIIRTMLQEQITPNVDWSINPMTAVARGAALYAATIDNRAKVEIEAGTVALDVCYEATSVDSQEYVSVKLDKIKSTCDTNTKFYFEISRGDNAWKSDKLELTIKGDVVMCELVENKPNLFNISVFDEFGNTLPSSPKDFTIIQGTKVGNATLPYHIAIGKWNSTKGAEVIEPIKGLERNKVLPAIGTKNDLKTTSDLRPGNASDIIRIPIYQADDGQEGVRAAYFNCIYEATISGECVPMLIPSGSDVHLTIKVDRSEHMTMEVYFPSVDQTVDVELDYNTKQKEISSDYLRNEISMAKSSIEKLQREQGNVEHLEKDLESVEKEFERNDQPMQILEHLRDVLQDLDKLESSGEWARKEKELRGAFKMLEDDNEQYGGKETAAVNDIRRQVDDVIRRQDIVAADNLLETMHSLNFKIATMEYFSAWLYNWNRRFDSIQWKNRTQARQLVNTGLSILTQSPTIEKLQPIIGQIFNLLPNHEIPAGAEGLLS